MAKTSKAFLEIDVGVEGTTPYVMERKNYKNADLSSLLFLKRALENNYLEIEKLIEDKIEIPGLRVGK